MTKFTESINKRRSLGVNSIILVVGKRGIGKSYASLFLCGVFDAFFSIDQVVFDVESFLAIMQDLKRGACVLFDESGIAVSSRTFMSSVNLIMSYVGESFRFRGVDLYLTVPSPALIDINMRQLADFMIRMTARGKGRVYHVSNDIFKSGHIKTPVLCNIATRKPDQSLCEAYEAKRADYLNDQYARWLATLKDDRIRAKPRTEINENAVEIVNRLKSEGIPKKKLAYSLSNELQISLSRSYQILAGMSS